MSRHSMITLVLGVVFIVATIAAVTMTGMSVMELILVGGLAAALLGGYVVANFQAGANSGRTAGATWIRPAVPKRINTWLTLAAGLIVLGIVASVALSGTNTTVEEPTQHTIATAVPAQAATENEDVARTVNTSTAAILPLMIVLIGATALVVLGLTGLKSKPSPATPAPKQPPSPGEEAPSSTHGLDWRQMLGLDESNPDDGDVAWWVRQLGGDEDRES